ncbi:MAG: thioredoxin family protein [Euryarchaeota archaeon]
MGLAIGDAAPPFELTNAHPSIGGPAMTFDDATGALGTVVVFECNHCPYVIANIGRMESMAVWCDEVGLGFVGINSNDPVVYPNDSFEHMQKRATSMGYPYLHDVTQDIARAYGAKRTPEFFLFDANDRLVYQGRMDDSPRDPSNVTQTELNDAIEALKLGQEPTVQVTESIGCSVKWKA